MEISSREGHLQIILAPGQIRMGGGGLSDILDYHGSRGLSGSKEPMHELKAPPSPHSRRFSDSELFFGRPKGVLSERRLEKAPLQMQNSTDKSLDVGYLFVKVE